jgi:hypothetical protein
MDKNQYIWNIAKTRCVKLSQIKEFTIQRWDNVVLAWLNANDSIWVYKALSLDDAVEWINKTIQQ